MRSRSLSTRLLASVSLLLLVFFGITIAALDTVYRSLSESFVSTRLELQVANLISASDEESGGRLVPRETLREPRFLAIGSGLYAQIERDDGEVLWWSQSLMNTELQLKVRETVAPGKRSVRHMQLPDGSEVQVLSVGLEWEFARGKVHRFVYTVAEDLQPYRAELQNLREQLFGWFAGLIVLLVASLAVLFRWVLKPVRQVEREIEDIEAGRANELHGRYPRELAGITNNMNALLRAERDRLERYRNTLGNLAHSLKTPLAVASSLANTPQLQEQITRMDDIVLSLNARRCRAAQVWQRAHRSESVIEACAKRYLRCTRTGSSLSRAMSTQRALIGDQATDGERRHLLDNACKFCRKQCALQRSH